MQSDKIYNAAKLPKILHKERGTVQVIKDLEVKGSSTTLKQGKVFKNIRLTSRDEEVECRDGKSTLVLKTCFLKKA